MAVKALLRDMYEDDVKDNEIKESINDANLFKCVFMAGGPGSGKSFYSKKMFAGFANFVNSDVVFERNLKKENLPFDIDPSNKEIHAKQLSAREAAKRLTDTRMGYWVNGMLPLVIDGTGKDLAKITKQKETMERIGYDTYMVFVNTSLEVAIERNEERERSVPEDFVKQAWNQVQGNIGGFQTLFGGENFLIVDNSKKLDGKEQQRVDIEMTKVAFKFIKSPLRNVIGKRILELLAKSGKLYLSDIAGMV
jgi:predicted kinase